MTDRTPVLLACEEDRHEQNSVSDVRAVNDILQRTRLLLKAHGRTTGRLAVDFDAETYDLVLYARD